MDTTIKNPLCPSMLAKSAVESGYAAQLAVKAKRVKYKDQIDLGIKLQVIAIETPGKMAEETVLYVKRLASKIRCQSRHGLCCCKAKMDGENQRHACFKGETHTLSPIEWTRPSKGSMDTKIMESIPIFID